MAETRGAGGWELALCCGKGGEKNTSWSMEYLGARMGRDPERKMVEFS